MNNLAELRNLLNEISDLSGRLEKTTQDFFWKSPRFLDPFSKLAERFNQLTSQGQIPKHAAKNAFWQMCMDAGFYPIKINRTQALFVRYDKLTDIKSELQNILKTEIDGKAEKNTKAKENGIK